MRAETGGCAESPEPRWAGAPEEFPPSYEEFAQRRQRYLDGCRKRADARESGSGTVWRRRSAPLRARKVVN